MTKSKDLTVLIISLLVTVGSIGLLSAWIFPRLQPGRMSPTVVGTSSTPTVGEVPPDLSSLPDRISLGNRQLIASVTTPAKREGIAAFEAQDYDKAVEWFELSLKALPNDPETLIYLNNARLSRQQTPYKIATSVPIGKNLNVAQEILRGVAQAQDEVNRSGGINGVGLEVTIINDDNDPAITREMAKLLVENKSLLAIVGHNTSDASMAAAPIYQQHGLVMISPTTFDADVAKVGNFVFRAVPTPQSMVTPLVDDILARSPRPAKILVCYDSTAPDNNQFRNAFVDVLTGRGGEIVKVVNERGKDLCDFASEGFDPEAAIAQALQQQATGLYLGPSINYLDPAIAVARANNGRLSLYSSPSLYTHKILQDGQQAVAGMILPTPWSPDAYPDFARKAQQLWGATVNWRTATAYDATQAIAEGLLRAGNSRSTLQQALTSPDFAATSAGKGAVRFLDTGDRRLTPVLVQVQRIESGSYRFRAID
ncbi:amino acid ABC transporter substrate-binding protein [Thermoleptolyngbya oregonensis NK1-22]|uniref:Amino acid ABC transporter substrate-binding protein n=1 Tax=Thermoleptolyngbya oregonensis NK1-22 TaxID=2547457 RepID=A0AA96YBV0_9CYAN|nr:ABC transporter substrate-binding protein [Thermoleptolyngbya oregonensis]WOB44813.1 amino acid ABC transporter substrate-binding protein [Thermoleptolyngbya oregonensis NK1-22]